MKQGVEKPHSDTQGQFCSTATQSKLPLLCQKQNEFQPGAITLKQAIFSCKGICLKHNNINNQNIIIIIAVCKFCINVFI